jgi:hypothetical protein
MQRMLALPVGGPEEPVLAPQKIPVVSPIYENVPQEIPGESNEGFLPPEAEPAPPIFEEFRFNPPPVRRPPEAREQPAPEVERRIDEETHAPLVISPERTTVVIAVWWLRPFLWCNQLYDRCIGRLGLPGRWLRGSRARNWLGWTGILLLFGTGAWVAVEWIGWIW